MRDKKIMSRIHSPRKGASHSRRPTSRRAPSWVTHSNDEVAALIVQSSKEEYTLSKIGLKLRDEYNIPLVKPLMGKSMTQVLKEHGVNPSMPEDLDQLLLKVKRLQDHLKSNPADRKNVRSMEILEAKIHRLSKYYKKKNILPSTWRYKAVIAQLA